MARIASFFALLSLVSYLSHASDNPPSAEQIVELAMPSIVAIRAETPEGISSGTGFIVDPSGVIVTNLHVIKGASVVAVKLHSGEQYSKVMVSSFDRVRDLVVLRIPGFELPALTLGNSDSVRVGATVYAIGNPLGLEESITKGIVSSIRVTDSGSKIIQTDSAVSPGNSGGPLLSENGEVIGVVTFKLRGGENLNFAVPGNYVRALLGLETLMSLSEFANELDEQEVSLFSDEKTPADSGLSGTWLSLKSNTARNLTISGDYIYGVFNQDRPSDGIVSNGTYDLKMVDDQNYAGTTMYRWNCWYFRWGKKVENHCAKESETELRVVSPNRIEGRMHTWTVAPTPNDREFKKACDSCFENLPQEWHEFAWVRQE